MSPLTNALSSLLGWSYFVAWSVSFYPQMVLNYRRGSVEGLSLDFAVLNVFGFICYSSYILVLLLSESTQEEFRRRFGDNAPLPTLSDAAFAVHALAATVFTLGQAIQYLGIRSPAPHPSPAILIIRRGCIALFHSLSRVTRVFLAASLLILTGCALALPVLDTLYAAGMFKLLVSLGKYIPQLLLNRARRSTRGWSVTNVLLDLTGGVLSFTQLLVDAAAAGGIWLVWANPAKLGLGLTSLGFDALFIVQHYVLYTRVHNEEEVVVGNGVSALGRRPEEDTALLGQ
ncbi:PQ loop repeat-domain-containing protein [Chytriomyces sp. MP71]|nr:PQ loop repeat-domain-containing protein [Chytriomyces sp. MP71]